MSHVPYTKTVKPGMYVYCPVHNANVVVCSVYYCKNTAAVNSIYADRISVPGVDAPAGDFSRPRATVKTILHERDSERGCYGETKSL